MCLLTVKRTARYFKKKVMSSLDTQEDPRVLERCAIRRCPEESAANCIDININIRDSRIRVNERTSCLQNSGTRTRSIHDQRGVRKGRPGPFRAPARVCILPLQGGPFDRGN